LAAKDGWGAESSFSEAFRLNPRLDQSLLNRGIARVGLGRLAEALADMNRYIELNPDAPDGFLNRAGVLGMQRRYKESLADLERAATLNPEDPKIAYNRIYTLFLSGDVDKARAETKALLARGMRLSPELLRLLASLQVFGPPPKTENSP
jgi:tetratricopeptide (TPR) repeat protein